jgi:LuxR family maltose regulon positive regulatory protein
VTGFRLAALSLEQGRDQDRFVKGLAEGSYYVREYLINEALSQVPAAFRRHLLVTSLLDRFCAPLCDVFCPVHDTQAIAEEDVSGQVFIEWLENTHLFVIPLDESHHWFRYHHVFQQLLHDQLTR